MKSQNLQKTVWHRAWFIRATGVLCFTLVAPFVLGQSTGPEANTAQARAQLSFAVATVEVAPLDSTPGDEVLVIGEKGEVCVYRGNGGELAPWATGQLEHPDATLYSVVPGKDSKATLYVLNPGGLSRMTLGAEPAGDASTRGVKFERVSRRLRFSLHTGQPVRSDFARDFDGDGIVDVLRPGPSGCEIWRGVRRDDDSLTYRRTGRFPVEPNAYRQHDGELLSDRLVEVFSIPDLELTDFNGDGRDDLLVERAESREFYLMSAEGEFPERPNVTVDLSVFRDTTPRADVSLGGTLTVNDQAQLAVEDLDADGVPDYVISHRRKLWIYLGTEAGPQFSEPLSILKVADDVTLVVVQRIGDDAWPDLLLFKLQLPTAASLLKGIFGKWDIGLFALGYRSLEGKSFQLAPEWKGEIRLRLPSIVTIMKNPYSIFEDFADAGSGFRPGVTADFTGDGHRDLVLLGAGSDSFEVWHGSAQRSYPETTEAPLDVQKLLFEETKQVWTLDRLKELLGSGVQARLQRLTGGRQPAARIEFPGKPAASTELRTLDLDGDGASEILVQRDRELLIYSFPE